MNKIHRKMEYALIALKHMSQKRPGELTTVKEICQKYGTPFDATARVMQQMVQGKFLKSEQGAYGGYLIMRDLTKVSVKDLIERVVGPLEIAKCINVSSTEAITNCDLKDQCNINQPLIQLNDQLIHFYEGINLHTLLNVRKMVDEPKIANSLSEPAMEASPQ
ncbi:MAG: Rrf2 family transcriptional regulator [Bdellovibrionaceae bacterium]|nr:Rrf2 family transcriptional regulator [Pseudobdellovibrionaceae bacterium]